MTILWSLIMLVTLVTLSTTANQRSRDQSGPIRGQVSEVSCSLLVSGEYLTSYLVTEPGLVTNVDLVNDGPSKDCQLRMLLVGGGGKYCHKLNGYTNFNVSGLPLRG